MKKITWLLILIIALSITPALARDHRGPQQFTITQPDGSTTTGQYVPDTGQVIIQNPMAGPTVMQQEPNHNWRITEQPPANYLQRTPNGYVYDGDDD